MSPLLGHQHGSSENHKSFIPICITSSPQPTLSCCSPPASCKCQQLLSFHFSHTTVWVKNFTPAVFWNFFQNGLECLIKILHASYTFTFTLKYKILFTYLQLWQSYAVLSTTTQWIFTFMLMNNGGNQCHV